MTKISETVVFFGSGPVAAQSLQLLSEEFQVEAVVTKPKPKHHKADFPVLELAERLELPIKTVSNKAELSELIRQRPFTSRLGVLIDFGIIVNQDVIDYFTLGIVNSHFSLLPIWRGADPITFAILNGDKQTGVSLMLLVEKMDEGPLLAQAPFDIPQDFTTPQLTQTLIELSHETLKIILPKYIAGEAEPVKQDTSVEPTYSRKLTKNDGLIDWHKPAAEIERQIRAFIDWPKSRTKLGDHEVIITKAHVVASNNATPQPGKLDIIRPHGVLKMECGDGYLWIDRLKPVGGKEMDALAFLAGHQL